jgi:hypothetical protein
MNNDEDIRTRRVANLELWDRLFPTDPSQTKTFRRAGDFSGTAIKPMWMVMRATEEFGPIGKGWGWQEIEHKIYTMTNEQAVWFSKVVVWYRQGEQTFQVGPQWGATELVARRGEAKTLFMDEEAAKKAVTDAVTKCLSYLGLAGDVHCWACSMTSKYVAERRDRGSARSARPRPSRARRQKAAAIDKKPRRIPSLPQRGWGRSGDRAAGAPRRGACPPKRATVAAEKPSEDKPPELEEQEGDDANSQDPANPKFNPRAWFERVTNVIRKAEDEEDVLATWAREKLVAKKLTGTKHAALADKAYELAKARLAQLRGDRNSEAAE